MTMDLMVAFALQKNVPELKNDERQAAYLKWVEFGRTSKLMIQNVI